MLSEQLLASIIDLIPDRERQPAEHYQTKPIAGGDVNTSYLLTTSGLQYFVKTLNRPNAQLMHVAEADGLKALRHNPLIAVPEVIGQGSKGQTSFILLQALQLGGPSSWRAVGRGLATTHKQTSDRFGWPKNNFIGTSVQLNHEHPSWSQFWWHQRLLPQLELAYRNSHRAALQPWEQALLEASERLLESHNPQPSLVHGDLWSGNVGFLQDGQPAMFDPACYYGDREVDLAMSQLFGGFDKEFYDAYQAAWPLTEGHQQRCVMYNLYHLLNHLNLFGSGYLPQCLNAITQLTAVA